MIRNEYKNSKYMIDVVSFLNFHIGLWEAILLIIATFIIYRLLALFFLSILRKRLQ